MKKILDHDKETGVTEIFHGSADGETYTIETVQDLKPLLDYNKALANEELNKKSELWRAAKIPPVVIIEWKTKFGVDVWDKNHWPAVKRLLNSSDYAYLRTGHFQI